MIKRILNWFQTAKPQPTAKDVMTQIGCHFEEVEEMAASIHDDILRAEANASAASYKNMGQPENFDRWAHKVYSGMDKLELLDALCDQIVTAVGVAYMMGYDIGGALAEVCRSNESKFEDGKPVFDASGKITKGKNYTAPDLARFIGDVGISTEIEEVTYPKTKGADLYLKLISDKGYRSEETHRVSPNQWYQIQNILNEKGENE